MNLILNGICSVYKWKKQAIRIILVELCGIEPQSETKLPLTSTCLERLFYLILLHTTCKATQDQPLKFILDGDTSKIYLNKGDTSNPVYLESTGEAARPL